MKDMSRFIDDGGSARITHLPQCVGCKHNLGMMNCEKLETKPERILQNLEDCPEREPEE
ncbi:MAG: hypothetical protein FWG31_04665 [Oscillospiraceae bacterium]|nr:hypothetical protein [Oscillospiraceae bacterium]